MLDLDWVPADSLFASVTYLCLNVFFKIRNGRLNKRLVHTVLVDIFIPMSAILLRHHKISTGCGCNIQQLAVSA